MQHTLGGVDTRLHILAGALKHLLALHIADVFAVHLHVQHELQAQAAAHNDHQARSCHGGQDVCNRVPYDDGIFADAAGKILGLGGTDSAGLALLHRVRQGLDVADARRHAHEGTGQVLHQRD